MIRAGFCHVTTPVWLSRFLPGCLGLLFCAGAAAAVPCPAEPGARYRIEAAVEVPPPRLRHDLGRAGAEEHAEAAAQKTAKPCRRGHAERPARIMAAAAP